MVAASEKAAKFYAGSAAAGYRLKETPLPRRTLEMELGVTTGGPHGSRRGTTGHDETSYRVFLDFIERLLQLRPEDRMSCADALRHPFLMPLYNTDKQQQLLRQQQQEDRHVTSIRTRKKKKGKRRLCVCVCVCLFVFCVYIPFLHAVMCLLLFLLLSKRKKNGGLYIYIYIHDTYMQGYCFFFEKKNHFLLFLFRV
ncbi:hypothetical protein STCU_10643 [Strigomonas culicis]|uniref:Protein kinase domain-containing protein n=1 Tax=Strigomonas culicis TaxID=28005 RepID=S9V3G7_9TRYP|nr:hypothetical protein STCU_10643 [Strigomonas culicis]|eukprot:EPY17405.1 hypothetical protein STCU_10643 [Strigomonas culicis]